MVLCDLALPAFLISPPPTLACFLPFDQAKPVCTSWHLLSLFSPRCAFCPYFPKSGSFSII